MQGLRKLSPLMRAIFVIGTVAALVTSVTLAALSSQARLTDNTISTRNSTTNDNLLLWDGNSFETTAPGFDVDDLDPGEGSDEYFFFFRNDSNEPLNLTVHVPERPDRPSGGFDFTGFENLEVTFRSYEPGCTNDTVRTNMRTLLNREVRLPCNPLDEDARGNSNVRNTEGNFSVSFDIDPSSVTGDDPAVGSFDFVFTGTPDDRNDD